MCWKWLGHYLMGASTYLNDQRQPTIHLCSCDLQQVHPQVVKHELLHVLVMQHGITGHPPKYAHCVAGWSDWGTEGLAHSDTQQRQRTRDANRSSDRSSDGDTSPIDDPTVQPRPSRVD